MAAVETTERAIFYLGALGFPGAMTRGVLMWPVSTLSNTICEHIE
jgi:hypothetical protein